ncbi:exosome complex component RRP4 [Zopfochytrium polystomum]|nr:exosome complex component RRP4 [Zopfochytrium polystomum]
MDLDDPDAINNDDAEDGGSASLVTPGQTITSDPSFMRGHGTYQEDPTGAHPTYTSRRPAVATAAASSTSTTTPSLASHTLVSSVAGTVDRINRLVSVRALKPRYAGEIGDVVVGRVVEITQKRWKVDIHARQDAVLMLASVNLPGGELRRRSEEDELQMRELLREGDLISAEIQAFFQDGAASLHTRSFKYGKLRTGSLVTVPSYLIKRAKSHFITIPAAGVDVILGVNGNCWVTPTSASPKPSSAAVADTAAAAAAVDAALAATLYKNENEPVDDDARTNLARVANGIEALAKTTTMVTEAALAAVFEAGLKFEVHRIVEKAEEVVADARLRVVAG